ITELETQLTNTQNDYNQIAKTKTDLEKQLRWLEELSSIETELQTIKATQAELDIENNNFSTKANQLILAKKANEINSDVFLKLTGLRSQIDEISNNLSTHKQMLPELEQEQLLAKSNLSNQQQTFNGFKQSSTDQLILIQQVRDLDTKIANAKNSLDKLIDNIEQLNHQFNAKQIEKEKRQEELNDKQTGCDHTDKYLAEHAADGELVTSLSGVNNNLDSLAQIFNDEQVIQQELSSFNEEHQQLGQQQGIAQHKKQQLQTDITQQQAELDELIVKQDSLSPDKNISELNKNLITLKDKHVELDKLNDLITIRQNIEKELANSQTKLQTRNQELALLAPQLKTTDEHLRDIERLIVSLNEQLILENKVLSLSREREKLQDNAPCPLCGSLKHPYALDNPITTSESQQRITQAKTKQQELQNKRNELGNQIAVNQTTSDELAQKITELNEKISEQQANINEAISNLDLIHQQDLTKLAGDIVTHIQELTNEILKLEQIIDELNLLNQQYEPLRQELQDKKNELAQVITEIATLNTQLIASQNKISTATSNIAKQQTKISTISQQLMLVLTNHGIR